MMCSKCWFFIPPVSPAHPQLPLKPLDYPYPYPQKPLPSEGVGVVQG
jgi:hypothetical protein